MSGYAIGAMCSILLFLEGGFGPSPIETELVTSIPFCGCAVDAALGGWMNNRPGLHSELSAAVLFFLAGIGRAATGNRYVSRQLLAKTLLRPLSLAMTLAMIDLTEHRINTVRCREFSQHIQHRYGSGETSIALARNASGSQLPTLKNAWAFEDLTNFRPGLLKV